MKGFLQLTGTGRLSHVLFTLLCFVFFGSHTVNAKSVELYTPYVKISVPPGESIDYTIDVINNSNGIRNVEVLLSKVPDGWSHILKSGGWSIEQLSVLPGEKKSFSLKLDVPLNVDKGTYRFNVVARGYDLLPLTVTVSEEGTFKSEFTSKQPNMEGNANSSFNYNAELKNQTAENQLYALKADVPRGWNVIFRANHKQATSVNIEPNSSANIGIEVNPPNQIKAGKYKIPILARTNTTSANLELEVVVTGSFEMELTTPTGLLSSSITAGDEKRMELLVKNTGSADLKDIELNYTAPVDWEVTFEPNKIDQLEAGKSTKVYALIQASRKAIPGDYVAKLTSKTPEASSEASFRISVKTPMLWGWMGVLIIGVALGSVYHLFKKHGRR